VLQKEPARLRQAPSCVVCSSMIQAIPGHAHAISRASRTPEATLAPVLSVMTDVMVCGISSAIRKSKLALPVRALAWDWVHAKSALTGSQELPGR
jgi:hypothetical protein